MTKSKTSRTMRPVAIAGAATPVVDAPLPVNDKVIRVADDVGEILNLCWWVRHYQRGARLQSLAIYRTQAIQKLGLTCREAFNNRTDNNFEPLLAAIVGGLRPKDDPPF